MIQLGVPSAQRPKKWVYSAAVTLPHVFLIFCLTLRAWGTSIINPCAHRVLYFPVFETNNSPSLITFLNAFLNNLFCGSQAVNEGESRRPSFLARMITR